ncbi:MAG: response regulator, partial [Elusimicrobia bacterium]|nr:response regulator [Elusimicrobiota bacterium]
MIKCQKVSQKSGKCFHGGNMSLSGKPNYKGKTILVVEDTDINKDIISVFLQATRVSIDFASNGQEAIDVFSANPDKYDLILMDIQMPVMDGLEATKRIRALDLPKAKIVPIIALTASVFLEDIQACLDAGMNNHIGKPINTEIMLDVLKKYMPETADQSPQESQTEPEEDEYAKFMPYIEVKDGITRFMNDKNLYMQFLGKFQGDKFCEDLINSIKLGDFKTMSVMAHTIKGVASNLALKKLYELSKEIEMQA